MTLTLTNTGAEPCVLKGFPGVSLAADANGAPIGAPAKRDETTPAVDVLLAPGQAGAAVLRYTQAGNYPDCTIVPAAGYRIYPAGRHGIPVPGTAHAGLQQRRSVELLTISAFAAK